ncbi:MAG: sigma-54-dependent transcriptional regulator [Thermodesulfobacteriota bacterium]
MSNILIIDDEEHICEMLTQIVSRDGHQSDFALNLEQGLKKAGKHDFDAILLDVCLPDGNGLDILPRLIALPSSPEVIIITGEGDPDGAEVALKEGAWDYIEKPLSMNKVTLPLTRALEYRELHLQSRQKPAILKREGIIGSSPEMERSLNELTEAVAVNSNVLISGETGTGKEIFARALHENSNRWKQNFIVVDCAALNESLAESTLFGHRKGAFTGAHNDHIGLVQQADKGTLFLDEVGELPLMLQKKFLRVLQEKQFRAVGGQEEQNSDFRLVAATNRDLDTMVQEGEFREDLLFRLRSIQINIPPLRDRISDIEEICYFYTAKICKQMGIKPKQIHSDFLEILRAYEWPGNVRELVNSLEQAISSAMEDPVLYRKHLPNELRIALTRRNVNKDEMQESDFRKDMPYFNLEDAPDWKTFRQRVLEEAEEEYFNRLISLTNGDIKQIESLSGLGHSRVYGLLKKHGLNRK